MIQGSRCNRGPRPSALPCSCSCGTSKDGHAHSSGTGNAREPAGTGCGPPCLVTKPVSMASSLDEPRRRRPIGADRCCTDGRVAQADSVQHNDYGINNADAERDASKRVTEDLPRTRRPHSHRWRRAQPTLVRTSLSASRQPGHDAQRAATCTKMPQKMLPTDVLLFLPCRPTSIRRRDDHRM